MNEWKEENNESDLNAKEVKRQSFRKRLIVGIFLIVCVCLLYFYVLVPWQNRNAQNVEYRQVDGVVYAMTFEPSHYNGATNVSDKWYIHIGFYNPVTGEDKTLKWEVTKDIFDQHKVGKTITVNVK